MTCPGCVASDDTYYSGCPGCEARAIALIPPYQAPNAAAAWAEYERRKRVWARDNPGAYPSEYRNAMEVIAQELGL